MTPEEIAALWLPHEPLTVTSLHAGTNNRSFIVRANDRRFVLRLYRPSVTEDRVRYEMALLDYLGGCNLSFAVPEPVQTSDGDRWFSVSDGTQNRIAVLFPWIDGEHPDSTPGIQRACGAALAELGEMLAGADLQPPHPSVSSFKHPTQIHPLVADPVQAVARIYLPEAERTVLTTLVQTAIDSADTLYARLPMTPVHCDFDGSNILVDSLHVTAVLDFEFAHHDARALDLAIGLQQFGPSPGQHDVQWAALTAFAAGYLERMPLKGREIRAVPGLMRLYRVVSLISRVGRLLDGSGDELHVLSRAHWALQTDRWLQADGERLVEMLLQKRG